MVCLDRDRGAICCCSGGARLPPGLAAGAGTGDGGGEDGGEVGAAPRSRDLRPQTAPGMPQVPDPDAEAGGSCGCPSSLEPGAGRWRAEAAGAGMGTTRRAARPPRCWIGLVKSLKKYICVWFLRPRV